MGFKALALDIFVALHTSQSQLHHNFTLRISTEVIKSRILSSTYKLLTLVTKYGFSLMNHKRFVNLSAYSLVRQTHKEWVRGNCVENYWCHRKSGGTNQIA